MFCLLVIKVCFISNTNTAANAKEMLMIELHRLTAEEDKHEDLNQDEPPTRKPRRERPAAVWTIYEIATE